MFSATIKIAYGFLTTTKDLDRFLTTRQVLAELQTLVKNSFNVEDDADIQIVQNVGAPHSELLPALLEHDELRRENETFFYARIVRRFNNIEYIKTDIDSYGTHRVCYLKKDELGALRQPRCFTETEIHGLQILQEDSPSETQIESNSQTVCVICTENQVHYEQRFRCHHLFCESCLSGWRASSIHFNCPLCRS